VISDRQYLDGQIWRDGPQWEVSFARCSGIAVAVNRRREGLAVGAVERRDNTVVVAYTAMMVAMESFVCWVVAEIRFGRVQ
jgi:hypothetical protein